MFYAQSVIIQVIPWSIVFPVAIESWFFAVNGGGRAGLIYRNTESEWGLVSIILHWATAVVVIALFVLGVYMVELSYYDKWYVSAPIIHKGVGAIVLGVVLIRLLWRYYSPPPHALNNHTKAEVFAARVVHGFMYGLLLTIPVSGYLITTAKGASLDIFGWFEIPSLVSGHDRLEEYAGVAHKWMAYGLMGLVCLHVAGTFKHHLYDRDNTLRRMLRFKS